MHFLPPLLNPTLVAAGGGGTSKSTAMLPEVRHLDIPWNEFYCKTITSSCAATFGYETQSTLSERDTYILRLHARARNTMSPRKHKSFISSPLPSSGISTTSRSSSSSVISRPGKYGVSRLTKRFRRETNSHRLSKAVLLKNSFEAAARDFDAMGNGFAAEKQRRRARLPQGFINRIAEQDDPQSWTFPPSRLSVAPRRNSVPARKSTLGDMVLSSGIRVR